MSRNNFALLEQEGMTETSDDQQEQQQQKQEKSAVDDDNTTGEDNSDAAEVDADGLTMIFLMMQ